MGSKDPFVGDVVTRLLDRPVTLRSDGTEYDGHAAVTAVDRTTKGSIVRSDFSSRLMYQGSQ